VARSAAYPAPPEVPVPAGEVAVEGLATVPPARVLELSSDTVSGSVWQNLSVERYAAHVRREVVPVVVLAASPAPGLAAVVEKPDAGIAKHREYSLTWYSLAVTVAGLWAGLNLRRRRT
jgi:surfeit locus 1 family protein